MKSRTALLALTLGLAGLANADVVISKLYGGGGNRGSTYGADFVELLNTSSKDVSLAGMTLYYSAAGGSGSTFTVEKSGALPNVTLKPGQHFLVGLFKSPTEKKALPKADANFPSVNPNGASGRFLLYRGTGVQKLSTLDPKKVEDYVGYGESEGFEGKGAAPGGSGEFALVRKGGGRTDTDDNKADFTAERADETLKIHNTASPVAPPKG